MTINEWNSMKDAHMENPKPKKHLCPKCGSEMRGPNNANDYYCGKCLIVKRGHEKKVK